MIPTKVHNKRCVLSYRVHSNAAALEGEKQPQARPLPPPNVHPLLPPRRFALARDPMPSAAAIRRYPRGNNHRHHIFREFLSLISGAGTTHTGVHAEDFTEEMMVTLPMDNYEDLEVGLMGGTGHAAAKSPLIFVCLCVVCVCARAAVILLAAAVFLVFFWWVWRLLSPPSPATVQHTIQHITQHTIQHTML